VRILLFIAAAFLKMVFSYRINFAARQQGLEAEGRPAGEWVAGIAAIMVL